ncbi:hypothetical protein N2W52_001897, partial [Clostridium perfringens]|nr:hypothetical protein [Clostridium perfringens]
KKNTDQNGNTIVKRINNEVQPIYKNIAVLTQCPSNYHRIIIDNFVERMDLIDSPLAENEFFVDYDSGKLYFNSCMNNKQVTIREYYGIGYEAIPTSRIYTKLNDSGMIVETLEDVVDKCLETVSVVDEINNSIEIGTKTKEQIESAIDLAKKTDGELVNNISIAIETNKSLERNNKEAESKNADLQDSIKRTKEFIDNLDSSNDLPKLRKDVNINILRYDQLNELISNLQKTVEDIKENGIIGGDGGNGGNNTAPTITSDFTKEVFTIDEEISVPYFIVDGEGGQMKAYYTINDIKENPVKVNLGNNEWKIGKLQKGTYKLKLYVVDRGGLFSNQLVFDIQVGALEITSNFNDKIDYKLNEEIIIGYNVNSMGKKIIKLKSSIDGVETTKEITVGFNNLNLGTLSKGVHKVSLQALYDNIVSNILTFNIVVTDSNTLFVSSSFRGEDLTNAEYISIPYRISLQGQKEFKVHAFIDDIEKPELKAILGINQFQVGYLKEGIHTVSLYATTIDGKQTSNTLSFQLNIKQSDFKMIDYNKDGLLLDMNAIGKTNASSDKKEWIDNSPYRRKATLNRFTFKQNGWINDSLVINGKANVEFDIKPLAGNCPKGVTVELYFKFKENSEKQCRFVQCMEGNNRGFYIDDEYAYLISNMDSIKYPLEQNEYLHIAYVIDWANRFEYIYINGCISSASLLYDSTDFSTEAKLKIGSCIPNSLVDCAFKNVRVYDRALDHTEILNNFASCKNIEEQKEIVRRNGENALPEMNIQGNFDGMGKDLPVNLRIDYRSKGIVGEDFSLPSCRVEWQGDSTLQYAVKNYSIKLYTESNDKYKAQPKESWTKTHRVWAKANMMDSSSATSCGIGHMFASIYKEKTPPMMNKKSSMYTVDSFPMLMYHNDKFAGIYNWMLPPKANPLGLDRSKPMNYNFGCEENAGNGIGAFNLKDSIGDNKIPTKEDILNGWSCYSDSDGNAFESFGNLLKWVNDCYWKGTDKYTRFPQFREEVTKKFSLPFLLDYYLFCYVFGLVDSLGKNLQLYSFGTINSEGEPIWYPMFFDFDTGLGCDNKGEFVWKPDFNCPEDYNTPHNLLWEMVRYEFKEELKQRYIEMRRSNLTNEKFKEVFYDNLIHTIGEKYYNMDALNKYFVWGSGYIQMFHGNKWLEMRKWFKERLIYSDTVFGYTGDLKHTIILRNTHEGQIELNMKVESPQFITTSFGGAEEANDGNVITKKCVEDSYTTYRYSYNGTYQKDAYITSASQITDLKGLTNSDLIMLDIQYATKLIDLDISNNPNLTALHMDNCENLESFNASGCSSLTSVLNFNNSPNLTRIDISNSGVQGIVYDKCSNVEYLNIAGSKLKTYVSTGVLETINLRNNTKLSDIRFINDSRIKNIEDIPLMLSEQEVFFLIDNCENLKDLHLKTDYSARDKKGDAFVLELKNMKDFNVILDWEFKTFKVNNVENLNINTDGDKRSNRRIIQELKLNNVKTINLNSYDIYSYLEVKNLIVEESVNSIACSRFTRINNFIIQNKKIQDDVMENYTYYDYFSVSNLILKNCEMQSEEGIFNLEKLKVSRIVIDSKINESLIYRIKENKVKFSNLNNVTLKTSGQKYNASFENCKNVTWYHVDTKTTEIINS